jgi:hypothetical protein
MCRTEALTWQWDSEVSGRFQVWRKACTLQTPDRAVSFVEKVRDIVAALADSGFYPHLGLVQPGNRIRVWADVRRCNPVEVSAFGPEGSRTGQIGTRLAIGDGTEPTPGRTS